MARVKLYDEQELAQRGVKVDQQKHEADVVDPKPDARCQGRGRPAPGPLAQIPLGISWLRLNCWGFLRGRSVTMASARVRSRPGMARREALGAAQPVFGLHRIHGQVTPRSSCAQLL